MSGENKNLHLTKQERQIIETGIRNGSTKAAIAQILGKDKSTIGKEIKSHREKVYRCKLALECSEYKKCKYERDCKTTCAGYVPFKCVRRDRSPGACNGCTNYNSCRFDKYRYNADHADKVYKEMLTDSRQGVDLTVSEAKAISDVITPLLKQGQSPYQIITNHPELNICEKTLYNYIEMDLFHELGGATVMDLRRQVSRKIPKKLAQNYKKREDRSYLQGRLFKDYTNYMAANPSVSVVEMDTVYNSQSGPFIQTFKFISFGLMVALYHETKEAQNMLDGLNTLERILGSEVFRRYVQVLLTDRGSEFAYADKLETGSDGSLRTKVFYCDPMVPGQKGAVENKHREFRYICPKGTDLKELGLTDQHKLNLAMSHVNSAVQEHLFGKSPLDVCQFLAPELYDKLTSFGIKMIPADQIILKPYLLKNR